MRRTSSDQGGRWPWGLWLALVGVSAGTVGSFAVVGWAFTSAAGLYDDSAAEPLEWDSGTVVIEAEPSEGESPASERDPDGPDASRAEPEPEPEAPAPEAEPEPEPEKTEQEGPRLVPVEDGRECGEAEHGQEPGGSGSDPNDEGGHGDDAGGPDDIEDALPELVLEFESLGPPRSME